MGAIFTNLTDEELCDLMCGEPEEDYEDEDIEDNVNQSIDNESSLRYHTK